MKQVLADNDPQRISEIIATIDQSLIMQEKGMSLTKQLWILFSNLGTEKNKPKAA